MTYSHCNYKNDEGCDNHPLIITADDDRHNRKDSATTPIDFNPTFYKPFEIKHRRRISREQFKKLEKAFKDNPKPNGKCRQKLAENVSMSARGVQVWFQNRRAKAKQQKENKKKQDKLQQSGNPNAVEPVLFSPCKIVHSRSQSSLSSISLSESLRNSSCFAEEKNVSAVDIHPSVVTKVSSQTWNSDTSTVTGTDEDDIKILQSPFTPIQIQASSHHFSTDTDFLLMNNTMTFQTPNENEQYASIMDRGQLLGNIQENHFLDTWAYILPPNSSNQYQPNAENSRYLGNELAYNQNVADWIKTVSLAQSCNTENEWVYKIQTNNRGLHFNEERTFIPLEQDDIYWEGQQIMHRISEPNITSYELGFVHPFNSNYY